MAYKRFYIIGSLSILGILVLITPFIDYYYGYEDKTYCMVDCFVKFCLKNGNSTLYFYNKNEFPLTFYPESKVKDVEFYKKDSRYKSGYREIDFITPYSKGVKYVFKIDAYISSCYAIKIKKEWWADVKWSFGRLDPELISGTQIGDKIVKEICNPVYADDIEEIIHYKTIKGQSYPNGTITNDTQLIDYIEKINKGKIQVDCIKTGQINVSGEIIQERNRFCKLEGTKVCCYKDTDGGQYAISWRTDESVEKSCYII